MIMKMKKNKIFKLFKAYFIKLKLHLIFGPFSEILIYLGHLSNLSKYVSINRNKFKFNDFFNSDPDFENRTELYEYLIKNEITSGPINFLEFGVYKGKSLKWWIENPDTSFLWQVPQWKSIIDSKLLHPFRLDYCRFGTPWRKRTKFLLNIQTLACKTLLCNGCPGHTVLRGTAPCGIAWTKVAEPYPHALADLLACAVSHASGWITEKPDPEVHARRAESRSRRRS